MLAQSEGLSARELGAVLELDSTKELVVWLGCLLQNELVVASGKTSGIRYFVASNWLRSAQLDHKTTLKRIAPHRLQALILEDLAHYPDSSTADVNRRIGAEISAKTVKRTLDELKDAGRVIYTGERRWRRYNLSEVERKGQSPGKLQ